MAEYAIGPVEEPPWRFEAKDFALRLHERWPNARIGINDSDENLTSLDALIPHDPPARELGIALHRNGQFFSLDPADPDTTAEFAVWLMRQVPANDPQVNIIKPSTWPPFPLTTETTEQQIIAFLEGQPG